jgi:ribose/xylose/arabinose/galactoside ABC-type transport system permease subunit
MSMENPALQQTRSERVREIVKRYYIYFVLALVVTVFSVVRLDEVNWFERGHFLNPNNIINLLRISVPIITVAGAFTFLMIAEYIDLSIGSAMSLSAVIFAWLILNGSNLITAMILINGFLVMKLNITPVIATLITLSLYKGIALLIVPEGFSSIRTIGDQKMPAWINNYAREDVLFGLPMAFFVAIAVIIILVVLQRKTLIGKYSAAIGGNPVAADLSGINRIRWVWFLYILVAVGAALAGIARGSFMSMGDPLASDGMELWVIIAVMLGGTKFTGGEGNVEKTVIAALIIIVITVGMLTVIPAYWQTFALGTVLLIAVVINYQLVGEN